MIDTLVADLRDVHQSLDSTPQIDKGAEVGQRRNAAVQRLSRYDRLSDQRAGF